jgi:hypothetical protein
MNQEELADFRVQNYKTQLDKHPAQTKESTEQNNN